MGSSELGPIYRRTGDPRVDGLGITIELSGAATHRADQAASHHGRAVGGASTSRNRRFESVPLQQTVRLSRDFSFPYRKAGSCRGVRVRPGSTASRDAQGLVNITLAADWLERIGAPPDRGWACLRIRLPRSPSTSLHRLARGGQSSAEAVSFALT